MYIMIHIIVENETVNRKHLAFYCGKYMKKVLKGSRPHICSDPLDFSLDVSIPSKPISTIKLHTEFPASKLTNDTSHFYPSNTQVIKSESAKYQLCITLLMFSSYSGKLQLEGMYYMLYCKPQVQVQKQLQNLPVINCLYRPTSLSALQRGINT